MTARPSVLCLLLLLPLARLTAAEPEAPVAPAVLCWQRGQEALRNGKVDEAIALYRASLALDAELHRNYLSLAAAYSAKAEDDKTLDHLTRYLRKQPNHVQVRGHLAELLLRLGRTDAARQQFARCATDLQERPDLAADQLIHCQSRLMELAAAAADEFGEHLHRGIGLYLLAQQRAELPEPDGELAVEGLLFKAAGELNVAQLERPDEARPCWYLHKVWSHLAQQRPADRWLRATEDAAPFAFLTPSERSELQAACRRAALARSPK